MNRLLPQEMTIDSVDEHLYRIGLCLTPMRCDTKRRLVHHPIVIKLATTLMLFQRTFSLWTTDEYLLSFLGDIGHFFRMKIQYNLLVILFCVFMISSQLIYYRNHKRGIRPTYLRLFQVMSGSLKPNVLELSAEELSRLMNLSRKLFQYLKFNCDYVITSICMVFIFIPFILNVSSSMLIVYGFMSAIHSTFQGNYFWNFLGYQYVYFYLVCRYLKLRLKNFNYQVKLIKSKRPPSIFGLIKSFNRLHKEIKEYNKTYLSKFLFIFWFLFASAIVIFLYIVIFVNLPIPVKIVSAYSLLIYFTLFLFTIMTAASINYHAKKSYSSLNSLFISMKSCQQINESHNYKLIKVFILKL